MKTTQMIAGVALASLLVIGPLTMTRAHEYPTAPGWFHFPMQSPAFAQLGENVLSVDLRVDGLGPDTLGQPVETGTTQRGFEVRTVAGLPDYIVVAIPGSASAALIQIDVQGRATLLARLHHFIDGHSGGVIICPIDPVRETTVITAFDFEPGMDPQDAINAGTAGAILYAATGKL